MEVKLYNVYFSVFVVSVLFLRFVYTSFLLYPVIFCHIFLMLLHIQKQLPGWWLVLINVVFFSIVSDNYLFYFVFFDGWILHIYIYVAIYTCGLSLSRTRKGPRNLFEIERVRDREIKLGWNQWKGTEKIVRDREKFEIEGVRDRESPLYTHTHIADICI